MEKKRKLAITSSRYSDRSSKQFLPPWTWKGRRGVSIVLRKNYPFNSPTYRSNWTHLYSNREQTEQKYCSQELQILEHWGQRIFSQKLQPVVRPFNVLPQHWLGPATAMNQNFTFAIFPRWKFRHTVDSRSNGSAYSIKLTSNICIHPCWIFFYITNFYITLIKKLERETTVITTVLLTGCGQWMLCGWLGEFSLIVNA